MWPSCPSLLHICSYYLLCRCLWYDWSLFNSNWAEWIQVVSTSSVSHLKRRRLPLWRRGPQLGQETWHFYEYILTVAHFIYNVFLLFSCLAWGWLDHRLLKGWEDHLCNYWNLDKVKWRFKVQLVFGRPFSMCKHATRSVRHVGCPLTTEKSDPSVWQAMSLWTHWLKPLTSIFLFICLFQTLYPFPFLLPLCIPWTLSCCFVCCHTTGKRCFFFSTWQLFSSPALFFLQCSFLPLH